MLTNEAISNRTFASLDDLEEVTERAMSYLAWSKRASSRVNLLSFVVGGSQLIMGNQPDLIFWHENSIHVQVNIRY